MKKAILIILIFSSCYFVYNITKDNSLFYLNIGDALAMGIDNNNIITEGYSIKLKNYLEETKQLKGYNSSFTNKDYRITDITNSIKYHKVITINKDEQTINELLKKADIITISLGMNELYYKLLTNTNNMYTYIDEILQDMEELLIEIKKYNNKKVIVLGYYNITNNNSDIFTYINYKLNKIVTNKNFIFINLNDILNKDDYNTNNNIFYPKKASYEKIFQIIVDKI